MWLTRRGPSEQVEEAILLRLLRSYGLGHLLRWLGWSHWLLRRLEGPRGFWSHAEAAAG